MRSEQALMAEIRGTRVDAEVAILHSYDDLWALGLQPANREFGYLRHLFTYYRALQRAGVPVDFAPSGRNLDRYKLVIAPTLFLADEDVAADLERYVEAGGRLLLSVRSGFKTPSNRVVDTPLPGPLASLVGAHVESWHSLPDGTRATLELPLSARGPFSVLTWAEVLAPNQAKPWGRFVGDLLAEQVGATLNPVGAGEVIYLGAWASEALLEALLGWLLPRSGVESLASLPPGMKAMRRRGDDQEFLFLLNFDATAGTATVPDLGYVDALTGQPLPLEATVPARDVVIARRTLRRSRYQRDTT
jgi:beta-galactosidase